MMSLFTQIFVWTCGVLAVTGVALIPFSDNSRIERIQSNVIGVLLLLMVAKFAHSMYISA